jgi:Family of unknown function (DUF6527)
MRLSELNPSITPADENNVRRLTFDCPCHCGYPAGIRIGPTQTNGAWSFTGEYPDTLSTQPSILIYPHGDCKGWHGYLTNGEMVPC